MVPVPPPHLAAGAYLQDHLSESAATLLGALCLRTQGAGRDKTVSPQPPGLPLRAARGPRRRRAESACSAPLLPTTRARGEEASSTPRGAFSVQPKGNGTGKSGEPQSYPGAVGFLRVEGQVTAGILEVEGQVTAMGLVPSKVGGAPPRCAAGPACKVAAVCSWAHEIDRLDPNKEREQAGSQGNTTPPGLASFSCCSAGKCLAPWPPSRLHQPAKATRHKPSAQSPLLHKATFPRFEEAAIWSNSSKQIKINQMKRQKTISQVKE